MKSSVTQGFTGELSDWLSSTLLDFFLHVRRQLITLVDFYILELVRRLEMFFESVCIRLYPMPKECVAPISIV